MKALLVIDMLKEDMEGLPHKGRTVGNISKLVDKFNAKKEKTVMVQLAVKDHKKTSLSKKWPGHGIAGTPGDSVIDELALKKYSLWVKKDNYSAFWGTELDAYLKKWKIKEVYIVGIHVNFCVVLTGVDAYYLGYDTFVVSDATTGYLSDNAIEKYLKQFELWCGKRISTRTLLRKL